MSSSKFAKPQPAAYRQYPPAEEEMVEIAMRDHTSAIFYEYIDERSSDDRDLSDSQRAYLHNSASSCIREIRSREACSEEQLDHASEVALNIKEWGEEFNSYLSDDAALGQVVQTAIEGTDGQPSVDSVIQHLSDVVVRVFECDANGIAQTITPGRLGAVFCYCYTVCKTFVQRTLSNSSILSFLLELGSYLVATLFRVKFYDWLMQFGGWRQIGTALMPRVPGWGNNLLLAGALLLGGIWVYRYFSTR